MSIKIILIIVWVVSFAICAAIAYRAPVYEQKPDGSWRKVPKDRIGKLKYKNDNNNQLQDKEQLTETANRRQSEDVIRRQPK